MRCCDGLCDCHPNCFHLGVCVRLAGGPFREAAHFRAAAAVPRAGGAGAVRPSARGGREDAVARPACVDKFGAIAREDSLSDLVRVGLGLFYQGHA